jgi:hypothetical protein
MGTGLNIRENWLWRVLSVEQLVLSSIPKRGAVPIGIAELRMVHPRTEFSMQICQHACTSTFSFRLRISGEE